jgi:hypothetical protein
MTADYYRCTSWCTHGDGHPDDFLRADQSCWGEEHVTVLGLEEGAPALPPANDPPDSADPHISVFAHQRWRAWPTIRLHVYRETENAYTSVDADVHLTPEEAVQLAKSLMAVAELIDPGSSTADQAINVRFPKPFEGLDFKDARSLAMWAAQSEDEDGVELDEELIWATRRAMFRCDECDQPDERGGHLDPRNCPGKSVVAVEFGGAE